MSSKNKNHELCEFSTGICGAITAGTGTLDKNGYFEKPCKQCADKANRHEGIAGDEVGYLFHDEE